MYFILLNLSFFLLLSYSVYSGESGLSVEIDTSRFSLKSEINKFLLVDNLQEKHVTIKNKLVINPDEEDEEKAYVSSFIFSEKVNSFDIGNGLIGIQLSSFSTMSQGSAQAAAGRDIFLVFDPQKDAVNDKIFDFGITTSLNLKPNFKYKPGFVKLV
jgi:hypothetical protein